MTATARDPSTQNGLFERLGGYDAIERAVGRLLPRIASDPSVAGLLPSGRHDDLRWGLQLLLTDRLGGPMAYDGPDLAQLRSSHGIDAAGWRALLGHTLACLAVEAADPASLEEARIALERLGASLGLAGAPVTTEPRVPPAAPDIVAMAQRTLQQAGLGEWNLFVLNPELMLVHQSPAAGVAAAACDAELRRAFGLGARELVGNSILRFHPAPTRLQGLLGDGSRLPQETVWGFGRVVWKASLHALRGETGEPLGFAMAWLDESDLYRARAAIERLRAQSEDLPVPVMFPDATLERWFGNAACEHALERLAPHLARPVNPLEGVPIKLFLPDEAERQALFADPSQLPFKTRVRIGPETISVLVAPVLDEEQRYLGPQITWEIVHFTREPASPERAVPAPSSEVSTPVERPAPEPPAPTVAAQPVQPPSPASEQLRHEARSLEAASQELLLLTRLLLAVADDTDGQIHAAPTEPEQVAEAAARNGTETAHVAEAALAVLAAAREVPQGHPRRQETARALATLTGIARRANRLALDGALLAVQDEAATQASELVAETRAFGRGLVERVRLLSSRAQASSEVLRQSSATTARLASLRAQLEDGGGQVERPDS
jgi:truncated hemoglobin YjbI